MAEQQRYHRRVIRVTADMSPNVRYARRQMELGIEPDDCVIVPGVLSWGEYQRRLITHAHDPQWLAVSLRAEFWKGAELLLFPPDWLALANARHLELFQGKVGRKAKGIGIDPAEGGDKTAMAASDELGLIELVSARTPNTVDVVNNALAFMRRHNMDDRDSCQRVIFDAGGGGKEHADRLRDWGYPVRTVAFGEAATALPRRGGGRMYSSLEQRIDQKEESYVYFNRRAEMYGELSQLLDPGLVMLQQGKGGAPSIPSNGSGNGVPAVGNGTSHGVNGSLSPVNGTNRPQMAVKAAAGSFAIPPAMTSEACKELMHQLSKFPRKYDPEGRLKLPPKNRRSNDSQEVTLTSLIGHSPDEADAFVLSVWAMVGKVAVARAGAV